jgi:hypothetical protein
VTVNREAGPLADEAAYLVEAALGWAQRAAVALDPHGDRLATGAPECSACPVCRTVGALRDPSPEFTERLTHTVTELATALAAGLRFAFDGHHAASHPGHADHTGHENHPHADDAAHGEHSRADDPPQPPHQRDGAHGAGRRARAHGSSVEHIDIV